MLLQRAFAKINFGLRVLRKRPDGYHDIETIFYRVNPSDEIFVTSSDTIAFECDDETLSTEVNLVRSAAELLQKTLGIRRGARIILRKNIPVGAGLGGGSADAAATLRLLCRLWDETPAEETLSDIARRLGSDVPYFLGTGAAHATSRGEKLDYFHLEVPYPIVILSPEIHVSTRDAYGAVAPKSREGSDDLKTLLTQHLGLPELLGGVLKNDFESPVFRLHPVLRELRGQLLDSGAVFCAMSGSGSSLFALYHDEGPARSAMETFRDRGRLFYTPPRFRPDLGIVRRQQVD